MFAMKDIWINLPNIGGLFTSIGIFLGAVIAIPKYIDYKKTEERNSADKRFLELSSRASSENIQEMVNSISSLPIFSYCNKPNIFYFLLPRKLYYHLCRKFYPYLTQTIDILINTLFLNMDNGNNPRITSACLEALSKIAHQTEFIKFNGKICLINLENNILNDLTLDYAYLVGSNFKNAKLNNSSFKKTDLSYADFSEAKLTNSTLEGSKLVNTKLNKSDLTGSILARAEFKKTNLDEAFIKECIFDNAKIHKIKLGNSVIESANFRDCQFSSTDFSKTKSIGELCLNGSIIEKCVFSNINLAEFMCRNTEISNSRINSLKVSNADFTDAILKGVNANKSELIKANFDECEIYNSEFNFANLSKTSFNDATFENVNFKNANLQEVEFNYVTFKKCNFEFADLTGAKLSNVSFDENCNLKRTKLLKVEESNVDYICESLTEAILDRKFVDDLLTIPEDEITEEI